LKEHLPREGWKRREKAGVLSKKTNQPDRGKPYTEIINKKENERGRRRKRI